MQSETENQQRRQQQSWKIKLYTRSNSKQCQFKFKATTTTPTSRFHQISLFFKLHYFFLQIKPNPQQPKPSFKSRILAVLRKLKTLRFKTQRKTDTKDPTRMKSSSGTWIWSGILMYFEMFLRNFVTRRSTLFSFVVALVCLAIGFHLDSFVYYYYKIYGSEFAFVLFDYLYDLALQLL